MENQNSYSLMLAKIKAHRYTKDVIEKALLAYDVTVMEWLTLGAVHSHGQVNSKQLALDLQVAKSLVSRFISSLEEKNLIIVKPSTEDKRWHVIVLSPKGQTVLEKIEPEVRQVLKEWLAPINREHVDIYISVILQVVQKLGKPT